MHLAVDAEDVRLLLAVLEAHATMLSHEIHKAATREFRKRLEQEEERTKALIARLQHLQAS
ncbi:MAG: hypothetical protein KatS3mg077_1640 [Candidatus Binatia bacterium]|nr:MAG: hypothetical protein KatS3mg077_1640 [Candidatus Binatia bacterium]